MINTSISQIKSFHNLHADSIVRQLKKEADKWNITNNAINIWQL